MLELLTAVSGVGPKVGLPASSVMEPDRWRWLSRRATTRAFKVASGEVLLAQRIVLEPKDKAAKGFVMAGCGCVTAAPPHREPGRHCGAGPLGYSQSEAALPLLQDDASSSRGRRSSLRSACGAWWQEVIHGDETALYGAKMMQPSLTARKQPSPAASGVTTIGQDKVKQNPKIHLEAARRRARAHHIILLYTPVGAKDHAGGHHAVEMGCIRITSGSAIEKPGGDLAAPLLTNLQGDVFIDEIHRLSRRWRGAHPALE